jgi:hypothetical protein
MEALGTVAVMFLCTNQATKSTTPANSKSVMNVSQIMLPPPAFGV